MKTEKGVKEEKNENQPKQKEETQFGQRKMMDKEKEDKMKAKRTNAINKNEIMTSSSSIFLPIFHVSLKWIHFCQSKRGIKIK